MAISSRAEATREHGEHYDPLFTYREGAEAGYFAVSKESGGNAADVGPSGTGTSKGSHVASSSFGWTTEDSASRSGSAIRIDSSKDFLMGPVESDVTAKMFEVTSSFGIVPDLLASTIYYVLPKHNLVAGVPPLGASTSGEPADFPEGSRGDMSTSTATDAAV